MKGVNNAILNHKHKFKSILTLLVIIIAIIIGYFSYLRYLSPVGRARTVVNEYLSAIEQGKSTNKYTDGVFDDFIDVLSYKFVGLYSKSTAELIFDYTFDEFNNSKKLGLYSDFKTWDDFKKFEMEPYDKADILVNNNNELRIDAKQKYEQYVLIYNLALTNDAGEKLYKKVYFTVDNKFNNYTVNSYSTK